MQEMFAQKFTNISATFDRYILVKHSIAHTEDIVCFFSLKDSNDKRWYLVGERVHIRGHGYYMTNVLEFRHEQEAAQEEFDRRRTSE